MFKTIILGLVLFGVSMAAAQERYVLPADEGNADPSFSTFRKKVIAAAERRDAKFMASVIDRNIRTSFGDSHGMADFNRMWKLSDPQDKFWTEFLAVIKNGGKFTGEGRRGVRSQFFAPYTYTHFPDYIDSFEHHVIFGKDVNLRERPDANSRVIERLSYNIVKIDDQRSVRGADGDHEWVAVTTLGGKAGFVKGEFVRSPIDYRAGFSRIRGVWKLTIFVAGD